MVKLVASLKKCGLIQTARSGSRCYIHITETAQALYGKPSPQKRFEMDNVTPDNDAAVTAKRAARVTHNHDAKEEQYDIEQEERYTQNKEYTNEELECVKREFEIIFPKRSWSLTEINCLKRQIPIPGWELVLVQRFYQIPCEPNPHNLPTRMFAEHEFLLARRRQSIETLLNHWSDEVQRALHFFQTDAGAEEARRRGWSRAEMFG